MKFLLSPLLLLLTATATSAQFFGSSNNVVPDGKPKNLNVTTSVKFVNEDAQQLGVRLINGVPTKVKVHIHNFEEKPITVRYVGGSLVDPAKGVAVKNFTSLKVGTTVGHDLQLVQPWQFTTDLKEQILQLQISLVLSTGDNEIVTVQSYNGPVSIVEPEASIFDPQMLFLYLILLGVCTSAAYFVYTTWFASVSPKPRRKFDTPKPVSITPSSSTSTGAKYEESWIPEHHLKRPGTKARNSATKARGKKGAE
ncbi:hypothetical protein K440DRAFT_606348 [Wilcoxina mikolae CBS 423.85]|nr:hypothetical protein K440DRAFT_606348 [Wilcoxina mikolae CBS 423.85]